MSSTIGHLTGKDRGRSVFGIESPVVSIEPRVELLPSLGGPTLRLALGDDITGAKAKSRALECLTEYRQSVTDATHPATIDRTIGELETLV